MILSLKRYILLCMLTVFAIATVPATHMALALGQTQGAHGQGGPIEMGTEGGKKENCRSKYPGELIAVIVPCIRDVFQNVAETMTDQFDDVVRPAIYSFITLVLTIFGVKVVTGEGDMKKQSFLLLMKIAGVMMFTESLGGFIPATFGMVQDGSQIVTSSLGSAINEMQCDISGYMGESPWREIDCILGALFGFAPGVIVGSSIFGLMGSALWSGSLGVTLFMGGIASLFLVLKLIIRATYTYLSALMVMSFLIIISPIMVPLLLLSVTFQYFEHWLKSLMSTMIQPLITLAFLTLCFLIIDDLMFDPEYGLIAQLPASEIEKMQGGKGMKGATSIMNNSMDWVTKILKQSNSIFESDYMRNEANPMMAGATNIMSANELYSFDFRGEGVSKNNKVFFAMVALALMAYLLNLVLESLTTLSQQILGGGFALAKDANKATAIEDKLAKMQKGMAQSWHGGEGMDRGGAAGAAAFVKNSAPAMVNGFRNAFR